MACCFTLTLFSIITALVGLHGRTLSQLANMTYKGMDYNCVNFYEQPAFDHPSLKHLIPQSKLSSTSSMKIKLDVDGVCPVGTVPIADGQGPPPRLPDAQPHCSIGDRNFYGTNARLSIHRPEVQSYQWSATRLKVASGYQSTSERIEAGWIVYPEYFHDNEAHLYVKYKTLASVCFNMDCPGFVQVSRRVALGIKPYRYSTLWGQYYVWDFSLDMNKDNNNWELFVGGEKVGYLPGTLFTHIGHSAAQVEWGGEINNRGPVNPAPYMGSGRFPYEKYTAHIEKITATDDTCLKTNPKGTEVFYDCPDLYVAWDQGVLGGDRGRTLQYGGKQNPT